MSRVAPAASDLLARSSIVICCGSGGVGKTTVAAALAVEAAYRGRRACVVTIDPAKRLADALGLDDLTNTPKLVDGLWPGELHALMLDTKSTFDGLVRRYAASAEQAEAILANVVYRNISGALSGTQEYMAMEKLHELAEEGGFDVVVVDTPPTRNALDFLDAPRRLTRFLDNRIFRLMMLPTRAYMRAVSVASQAFLRSISRAAGGQVVSDAVAFFRAFEGMEQGFRERAAQVQTRLEADTTAFVLVTSPRRDAVDEAGFFVTRLKESGLGVDGLVINRVHPRFGDAPVPQVADGSALAPAVRALSDFRALADREEAHVAELTDRLSGVAVARVPFLATDVHDLAGLAVVASHLFGERG